MFDDWEFEAKDERDESLIPMTPEETGEWKGGSTGKATSGPRIAPLPSSLEARLDEALAEPDHEREERLRYLGEFRKQKKLRQRLERQVEARDEMRVETDQVLKADRERSKNMSQGATAKNRTNGKPAKPRAGVRGRTPAADLDIPYIRNQNGELVPYRGTQYVKDENGNVVPYDPRPRQQFTQQDRERVNRTRDQQHGRRWWLKKLIAYDEGKETMTREQLEVHMAIGRAKGWLRPPSRRRA